MKRNIVITMVTSAVLLMSGCGGGGGKSPDLTPKVDAALEKQFSVQVCTSENKSDAGCDKLGEIDLDNNNVAVLSAPDDIGVSPFAYFDGKRFIATPKGEIDISILNALAQALSDYSNEPCAHPCPRLVNGLSYEDAQNMLKDDFGLTGTDEQNEALLDALNYNMELLGEQGVPLAQAYDADIKAMAESLVNLTVKEVSPNLNNLGTSSDSDCVRKEHGICVEWGRDLSANDRYDGIFLLTRRDAESIARDIRAKSDKPNTVDKVFEKLSCEDNEDKQIYMYGVYDNFSQANAEPTNPSPALTTGLSFMASYIHGYDYPAQLISAPSVVIESLSGIPATVTNAQIAIGLKEGEQKDSNFYVLGTNLFQSTNVDATGGPLSDLYASWTAYGTDDIYYADMSQLVAVSGETMLQKLQSAQELDFFTYTTVNIDFIAVGACVPKKEPEGTPIKEIPVKLVCSEEKGEHLVTVWGGTADDFAVSTDTTTPSAALLGLGTLMKYDDPIVKKAGTFGDTLANPNAYVTQMELLINTRPSAAGAGNDRMFIGNVALMQGAEHNPNDTGAPTLNNGTAHLIYGSAAVHDNNNAVTGDLISLLNTGSDLDIAVLDQTEVDVARLSMCVVEKEDELPDTDGDGVPDDEDCDPTNPKVWEGCDDNNETNDTKPPTCSESISIDLSQASGWTDTNGDNPTVHNEFTTYPPRPELAGKIWDGNLTWFNFGSANGAVHELGMDFCACGDTNIIINEFKSDNYGKMYLDTDPTPSSYTNPNYIVSRSLYTQSTMASWGTHEGGSLYVPYGGSAADHTLNFNIKNQGGPSGGAVSGTLDFIGHMGKCTPADTPPPTDTDGDGVPDSEDCAPNDPNISEGCDEGNTTEPEACSQFPAVELDLRPATSWIDNETGVSPIERIDTGFWDTNMNWFGFDEGWEKVHNLSIDFCSCGTVDVNITEMKSDNLAKIYLDDDATPANYVNTSPNNYIVTRTINQSTATMSSTAVNESGTLQVLDNGAVSNHVLHFDVKNGSGTAGGAVDGSLKFRGHLGQCVPSDYPDVPTDDNSTVVVHPDNNWTVLTDMGSVADIIDITWNPAPDSPVGESNDSNGTVVIGIAGPVVVATPSGKPFVDYNPDPIGVPIDDIGSVGLDSSVLVLIDHLIDPPHYSRDSATQIVTDHQQNLQWQDDEAAATTLKPWLTSANYSAPYSNTSGDTATTYCANLALGGYTDWRLPSRSELEGILDHSTTYPSIDTSVFLNTIPLSYWSSTTGASYTSNAWIVNFYHGYTHSNPKTHTVFVRCVR